jgi:hypothetical protein
MMIFFFFFFFSLVNKEQSEIVYCDEINVTILKRNKKTKKKNKMQIIADLKRNFAFVLKKKKKNFVFFSFRIDLFLF